MSPAAGKVIISGKENAEMRFPSPSSYVSIKNCGVTPSLSPPARKKTKRNDPRDFALQVPKGSEQCLSPFQNSRWRLKE